jgi:lysophospholipase L1-like esterase
MKTFLAIGDSYTIGEQVLLKDSFPYQVVQMLRKNSFEVAAPEIVAKTGWTTANLLAAIAVTKLLKQYDFVSLLIGVNSVFEKEFEALILKSISLTNKTSNVFVLSIPDWGVTPFAKEKDVTKIATEIDKYNTSCKKITLQYNCTFIDITTDQRADVHDAEMHASDGLHPSRKEYAKWAALLSEKINAFHFS